ncbi:maleylacetate reductase [Arthrobacter sp. Hiyo8]|nr:maleylacetate reductase [Arthrobacter sp. Hiyo8]
MRATLGATTMSLHHKLCHTLGGTFNLPHAETHTVVLPYALAYNSPTVPAPLKPSGVQRARTSRQAICANSVSSSAHQRRYAISGSPERTSKRQLIWQPATPTPTRAKSRPKLSGGCSLLH